MYVTRTFTIIHQDLPPFFRFFNNATCDRKIFLGHYLVGFMTNQNAHNNSVVLLYYIVKQQIYYAFSSREVSKLFAFAFKCRKN